MTEPTDTTPAPAPAPPPPPQETPWQWLRRNARWWGFGVFVVAILIIFRSVILPFVLALLVAYILAPLVRRLQGVGIAGRRAPRFVWIILVYALLLGLIGVFFTSFVPRLSQDIKRVLHETPAMVEKVREEWVPSLAGWVEETFSTEKNGATAEVGPKGEGEGEGKGGKGEGVGEGEGKGTGTGKGRGKGGGKGEEPTPRVKVRQLESGDLELDVGKLALEVEQVEEGRWLIRPPRPQPAPVAGNQRIEDAINSYINEMVTRSEKGINRVVRLAQGLLTGVFKAITTFILVLMVSAFLLADTDRLLAWMRNLTPRVYDQDFSNLVGLVDKGLSGAIRGQFFICLINGFLTWIGLHLIGVKYPLLLSLLAGVMSLIPIFGSILSSIPIVVVALVSGGVGVDLLRGVLILLWIIGIHLLEANLLNPKIMGTAAKIHPVLVVFAVVAGERTYGAVGALLGVPLFSAVQAVFLYVRGKVRGETEEEKT